MRKINKIVVLLVVKKTMHPLNRHLFPFRIPPVPPLNPELSHDPLLQIASSQTAISSPPITLPFNQTSISRSFRKVLGKRRRNANCSRARSSFPRKTQQHHGKDTRSRRVQHRTARSSMSTAVLSHTMSCIGTTITQMNFFAKSQVVSDCINRTGGNCG